MALFQVIADGVSPFEHVPGGPELYEKDIEELVWENLAELTGESMFGVKRQANVAGGFVDILAIDAYGNVVVIEIKRTADRKQLAQCLEYAGWARQSSLEELAALNPGGKDAFWSDWLAFTETDQPVSLSKRPRVLLIAQMLDERTRSATEFLAENGVPISVITMSMYKDAQGTKFLDVAGANPGYTSSAAPGGQQADITNSGSVTLADLLNAGFLQVNEELTWTRPKKGVTYTCFLTTEGRLKHPDGAQSLTPSGAAKHVTNGGSFDGWNAWRSAAQNKMLHEMRRAYTEAQQASQIEL